MRLVALPAVSRRTQGRAGRGLVLGIVAAAAIVGAGAAVAAHALITSSAKSPASTKVVDMRYGLYGEATWAAGTRPAPPIDTLRDQRGGRFSLSSLHGHPVAIAFFDSYCHQECPLEGRQMAAAELRIPRAQRPDLVVVSVNPKDNPGSVAKAIRDWGLAHVAPWHWLMGTHQQLARIWADYGIQVSPPIDGDINHTEALYLLDRRGYERAAYLWPFASRFATYDMRVLATRKAA
jgi:cytochrome oxidase Cu insertion factor (SCO1/SenC/PrrC family)